MLNNTSHKLLMTLVLLHIFLRTQSVKMSCNTIIAFRICNDRIYSFLDHNHEYDDDGSS